MTECHKKFQPEHDYESMQSINRQVMEKDYLGMTTTRVPRRITTNLLPEASQLATKETETDQPSPPHTPRQAEF